LALLALGACARAARAQSCDTLTSRVSLAAFAGDSIRELSVETRAPEPTNHIPDVIEKLHVRTRESTVRRQLVVHQGEPLDTLAIAESLRLLRHRRYLADAYVTAARCAGTPGIALTVHTRDAWSTKPSVSMRANAGLAGGVEERNFLGTGRRVSLGIRGDGSRLGIAASIEDPWVVGTRMAAALSVARFNDGRELSLAVGTRERSVFDPFSIEAVAYHATRATATPADTFTREGTSVRARRRIAHSERRVWSILAGAEWERTSLLAGATRPILGARAVEREFVGADLGLSLRSASYDTLTWLIAEHALVDVPRGIEGELVLAPGLERRAGKPALRADSWIGRVWLPSRSTMLIADAWASGFFTSGRVDAMTLRASLRAERAASSGIWALRIVGERLAHPDPDLKALIAEDPAARTLPPDNRLAEATFGISLERQRRLLRLSRSWTLGVGAFAASSMRWDAVGASRELVHAEVLGVGLRLVPGKLGRGTFRLDVGVPVNGSVPVRRRPFVAVSVAPWWEDGRSRR
jgi:hypothetical protein